MIPVRDDLLKDTIDKMKQMFVERYEVSKADLERERSDIEPLRQSETILLPSVDSELVQIHCIVKHIRRRVMAENELLLKADESKQRVLYNIEIYLRCLEHCFWLYLKMRFVAAAGVSDVQAISLRLNAADDTITLVKPPQEPHIPPIISHLFGGEL